MVPSLRDFRRWVPGLWREILGDATGLGGTSYPAGGCAGDPPAGVLTREFKIGGNRVARLPAALPKTLAAADHVRRCASRPDDRRKAIDLVQAVAAVECGFTLADAAAVPAGMLRDLVLITAGLAGGPWLRANAEQPAAAEFVSLNVSPQPPPLPELDQILATLLWRRFSRPLAGNSSLTVLSPARRRGPATMVKV